MAAVSPLGAFHMEGPFPIGTWIKVHEWTMPDGSHVELRRNGDVFKYRWWNEVNEINGVNEIKRELQFEGSPNDFFRDLVQRSPLKVGEEIRFIKPIPSAFDNSKIISRDMFAVTLACQFAESTRETRDYNPCHSLDFSMGLWGHAAIYVERINKNGQYERNKLHIYVPNRKKRENRNFPEGFAKISIRLNCIEQIDPEEQRSDTFLRPAELVQNIINRALEQKSATENAVNNQTPPPVRFNMISPNPDQGIHNCLSWSFKMLEFAEIPIPRVKYWVPGTSYVPKENIGPSQVICKKASKDRNQLMQIATAEEMQKIENLERILKETKGYFKPGVAAYGRCLLICAIAPPAWLFLPVVILYGPIGLGAYTYSIYRDKRNLKKAKEAAMLAHYPK